MTILFEFQLLILLLHLQPILRTEPSNMPSPRSHIISKNLSLSPALPQANCCSQQLCGLIYNAQHSQHCKCQTTYTDRESRQWVVTSHYLSLLYNTPILCSLVKPAMVLAGVFRRQLLGAVTTATSTICGCVLLTCPCVLYFPVSEDLISLAHTLVTYAFQGKFS